MSRSLGERLSWAHVVHGSCWPQRPSKQAQVELTGGGKAIMGPRGAYCMGGGGNIPGGGIPGGGIPGGGIPWGIPWGGSILGGGGLKGSCRE